jgi:hypothetical protein
MRHHGLEIRQRRISLLDGARESLEPLESVQLFLVAEPRGVQRISEHGN